MMAIVLSAKIARKKMIDRIIFVTKRKYEPELRNIII